MIKFFKKKFRPTLIFFFVGVLLFLLSIGSLLFLKTTISYSYQVKGLMESSIKISTIIPAFSAIYGGDFVGEININGVNSLGETINKIIYNVDFTNFKIDIAVFFFLSFAFLSFILAIWFNENKIFQIIAGSSILISGFSLMFQTLTFEYFNGDLLLEYLNAYLPNSTILEFGGISLGGVVGGSFLLILGAIFFVRIFAKNHKTKKADLLTTE